MLHTTDIDTLKTVAKNLGHALKNNYDTHLSHSATLNLAARAFGFENYNTAKALLEKNPSLDNEYNTSYHLLRSMGISENETDEIITWYKKYVDYGSEQINETLREATEYISENPNLAINEIYMTLWSMVLSDAFYFMTQKGQDVYNYRFGDEPVEEIVSELKRGDIAGLVQSKYYQMSMDELKESIIKAKNTGKNLMRTASAKLISPLEDMILHELINALDGNGVISISALEKIFKTKSFHDELERLKSSTLKIRLNGKEEIVEKAISDFHRYNDSEYLIDVSTIVGRCFK